MKNVDCRTFMQRDGLVGFSITACGLGGYHMPFPGLGHVRVDGKGYEWVPRPWVT